MSGNTLDLTNITSEPVESNIQVEIADAPEEQVEESTEVTEEKDEEEVVEEKDEEEVVEEKEEEEVVEEKEEEDVVEEKEEEEVVDVTEEKDEETPAEADTSPIGQVAADIRNILTEVTTTVETTESEPVSTTILLDNLCSLKTLVEVLGKWSGNEIKRRQVENLLKEGTALDENLDDLEKAVEILQIWIGEGGSKFREHNHFKKLDEYTSKSESRNLSQEKKVEVLKTITELVINVSNRRVNNSERDNIFNNIY